MLLTNKNICEHILNQWISWYKIVLCFSWIC